jgi:DNA-binding response OmpR family regulator
MTADAGGIHVARLLVLSPTTDSALPSLGLLSHQVKYLHSDPASLVSAPIVDAVLLDARADLVAAKALCRILTTTDAGTPVLLIVTEGGFAAVSPEWGVADVLLSGAGPAEVDARIRLALGRGSLSSVPAPVQTSGVTIDEASYSAKVAGRPMDLTYKEFQLLHFFATHPSRVFTREQLLSEVWGYDYFGGTRTVDVHVRRLRAKLGDMEQLIGTVRNVGYRFNAADDQPDSSATDVTSS